MSIGLLGTWNSFFSPISTGFSTVGLEVELEGGRVTFGEENMASDVENMAFDAEKEACNVENGRFDDVKVAFDVANVAFDDEIFNVEIAELVVEFVESDVENAALDFENEMFEVPNEMDEVLKVFELLNVVLLLLKVALSVFKAAFVVLKFKFALPIGEFVFKVASEGGKMAPGVSSCRGSVTLIGSFDDSKTTGPWVRPPLFTGLWQIGVIGGESEFAGGLLPKPANLASLLRLI